MVRQEVQVKELVGRLAEDQHPKARAVEQHPRDQGKGRKDPNPRQKAQATQEDMILLHRHHHRKEAEVRPHLLHHHLEGNHLVALPARVDQTHRILVPRRMRVTPQTRNERSVDCGES